MKWSKFFNMKWLFWFAIIATLIAIVVYIYYRNPALEEGFQQTSITLNSTVYDSNPLGTNGTYTIFDPTAAYLQAQLYAIEYPPALNNAKEADQVYIDNLLNYSTSQLYFVKTGETYSSLGITYDKYTTNPDLPQYLRLLANYIKSTQPYCDTDIGSAYGQKVIRGKESALMRALNLSEINGLTYGYDYYAKEIKTTWPRGDYAGNYVPQANKYSYEAVVSYFDNLSATFMQRYNYTNTFMNNPIGFILSGTKMNKTTNLNVGYINNDVLNGTGNARTKYYYYPYESWIDCIVYDRTGTAKYASIPGERDGKFIFDGGGGIAATILLTPNTWEPRRQIDGDSQTNMTVDTLIANFKLSKENNPAKFMWAPVQVQGTITQANINEINNSITYAMYFNFTDISTTGSQIQVQSSNPFNLIMSTDCSGMNEFKTEFSGNQPRIVIDPVGVEHNAAHCIPMPNLALKVLPFHTRDYIRRWAIYRRNRITEYWNQMCQIATANYNTVLKTPTVNVYKKGSVVNPDIAVKLTAKTSACDNSYNYLINSANTRTYNETLGSLDNPANHDICPEFNLLSVAPKDPQLFNTQTVSSLWIQFTQVAATETVVEVTYKVTMTVSKNVQFLQSGTTTTPIIVYVQPTLLTPEETASIKNSMPTYTSQLPTFSGTVKSYNPSTGDLEINLIYLKNIIPAVTDSYWTSQTNRSYVVSHVDDTFIYSSTFATSNTVNDTNLKTIPTVVPSSILPTTTITMTIPKNTLTTGAFVTVADYTNPLIYFKGTINGNTPVDNQYSSITIGSITNSTGNFSLIPVTYMVSVNSSITSRSYLLVSEKRAILDKIAQKYYDINLGTNRIVQILDVFQLGETIFDVRFKDLEKDTKKTRDILTKLNELRTNYEKYRTYNLSESDFLALETSYIAESKKLNTDLQDAVTGVATDCGTSAQYVKIQIDSTSISNATFNISQIQVIDSTGTNVAYGAAVTTKSTLTYAWEFKSGIDRSSLSTAQITQSLLAETTAIQINRNNMLVDGNYNQKNMPNTYVSAGNGSDEYILLNLSQEYDIAAINIIHPLDYSGLPKYIVTLLNGNQGTVALTLSTGVTVGTNTLSTLVPANPGKNRVNSLTLISSTTAANGMYNNQPKMVSGAQGNFLDPNRDTALPTCATTLSKPFKVARFYATITPAAAGYLRGQTAPDINRVSFTGFSLGANAALTFNPMYNAGFVVDLMSTTGNMMYKPKTVFTNNNLASIVTNIPNQSKLATMITTSTTYNPFYYNDAALLKLILQDYRTNIISSDFTERADIVSFNTKSELMGYTADYEYFPKQIIGAVNLASTDSTIINCAIAWVEDVVSIAGDRDNSYVANQTVQTRTRYGKFVYKFNQENWGANDIFYDIKSSQIYQPSDMVDGGKTQFKSVNPGVNIVAFAVPILIDRPLPLEVPSLDNALGSCPSRNCSDPYVIDQLVKEYNDPNYGNVQDGRKILRVTKAVTPGPLQCDYNVYMSDNNPHTVSFNLAVSIDTAASAVSSALDTSQIVCKYSTFGSTTPWIIDGTGTYIQEKTPLLAQVYNFATEYIKPFAANITSAITSLTTSVNSINISDILQKYRLDTYGAYGQIQPLGKCTNRTLKCSDPQVIAEFIKYYIKNNWDKNQLLSVDAAGTFSNNQCDYRIQTKPITGINRAPISLNTSPGQSSSFRAIMTQPTDKCYFTVSSVSDITATTTSITPTLLNTFQTYSPADVMTAPSVSTYINIKLPIITLQPIIFSTGVIPPTSSPLLITSFKKFTSSACNIISSGTVTIPVENLPNPNNLREISVYVNSVTTPLNSFTATIESYDGKSLIVNNVTNLNSQTFARTDTYNIYFISNSFQANVSSYNNRTLIVNSINSAVGDFPVETYTSFKTGSITISPVIYGNLTITLQSAPTGITLNTRLFIKTEDGSKSFRAIVAGVLTTTLTVNTITEITGNFTNAAVYTINVITSPPTIYYVQTIQTSSLSTVSNSDTPWLTPTTIGVTSLISLPTVLTTPVVFTVDRGSNLYQTNIVVKVVDTANSGNFFNATISSYTSTTGSLNLSSITGVTGTFGIKTTYNIQIIPPSYGIKFYQKVRGTIPVSPLDFIDCSTRYAVQQIMKAGGPVVTSVQNLDNKTCVVNGINTVTYNFSKYADPNVESLVCTKVTVPADPRYVAANNVAVTYSDVTSNSLGTSQTSCPVTDTSYTGALKIILAQSGYTAVGSVLSSGTNQYDFAISNDYDLPFTSLYKSISFYLQTSTDCSTAKLGTVNGADISVSPFAHFRQASTTPATYITTNITTYITTFRTKWNQQFQQKNANGTYLVPVSYYNPAGNFTLMGKVSSYAYDSVTDSIFFKAEAADFGPNSPTDIRNYYSSQIFQGVFRYNSGIVGIANINTYSMAQVINGLTSPASPIAITAVPTTFTSVTDTYTEDQYYKIRTLSDAIKTDNKFIFLRFSVQSTPTSSGTVNAAEITRLFFYQRKNSIQTTSISATDLSGTSTTGTSPSGPSALPLKAAIYTMSDNPGGYYLYNSGEQCKSGYTFTNDPNNTSYGICAPTNSVTYTKGAYPCGIGYYVSSSECISTGYFSQVGSALLNPNQGTSRLKMNIGQFLYVNLIKPTIIDAFTFVTGVSNRRPLTWTLEGSVAGLDGPWIIIHQQTTAFPYDTSAIIKTQNNKTIYSFLTPAYFLVNGLTSTTNTSIIQVPTTTVATVPIDINYSNYTSQTMNFLDEPANSTPIFESFANAPLLAIPEAPCKPQELLNTPGCIHEYYTIPLLQAPIVNSTNSPIPARRIQNLRFTVLETYDPESKYVHMSNLRFHTPLGTIPPSLITIANPMGTRKIPQTGPDALLGDTSKRWVDYNKKPLLLNFKGLPPARIIGFQFSFPTGVPDPIAAMPIRWILEGSYDGRTWEPLHEMKIARARFINDSPPVYKFLKEI